MRRSIPPDEQALLRKAIKDGKTQTQIKRELGLDRNTIVSFAHRENLDLHKMSVNVRQEGTPKTPAPAFSMMPPEDLTAPEILEYMAKKQRVLRASHDARKWREISIDQSLPFGIVWFTDIHLGDPGTDYEALREDLALAARVDHVYSAFIGDASNNWPKDGKLAKQWAEQDASIHTERALVKWFMTEAKQRWLFWVIGNHDVWNEGFALLKAVNADMIPMENWRAKFKLAMPGGRSVRIDAAHDFKGNSMWNNLHALVKESRMGEEADLFIAGHRHESAINQQEVAERGHGYKPWLVRCRGYKFMDEYAHRKQYAEQRSGMAVMTIIDPTHKGPNPITHIFDDLQQGADFLKWFRNHRAKAKP